MKTNSTFARKAALTLAALGAIVLMTCTPMAALAHSVSANGGGNQDQSLLSGLAGTLLGTQK